MGDFDCRSFRYTIKDFYVVQNILPTLRKLLPAITKRIQSLWAKYARQSIFPETGFAWKQEVYFGGKRRHCTGGVDTSRKRKKLRTEKETVLLLMRSGRTATWKCWQGWRTVWHTVNAKNRLGTVNTRSNNGSHPEDCTLLGRNAVQFGDSPAFPSSESTSKSTKILADCTLHGDTCENLSSNNAKSLQKAGSASGD